MWKLSPEKEKNFLAPLSHYTDEFGVGWVNHSNRWPDVVAKSFPKELREKAQKIIAHPDFSPPGIQQRTPTGTCVRILVEKLPHWRRYALSDVGCGYLLLQLNELNYLGYIETQKEFAQALDSLAQSIATQRSKRNSFGDLGGGNHFVTFYADQSTGETFVLIHTGSRDESEKATEFVDQPKKFDETYAAITDWAFHNRQAIGSEVARLFGHTTPVLDTVHNSIHEHEGIAHIYKGSVHLSPGDLHVIPSHMTGPAILVQARENIATLEHSLPHGTGRSASIRVGKQWFQREDVSSIRQEVLLPAAMRDEVLRSQGPKNYRTLQECLPAITPFAQVLRELTPFATLMKPSETR